LQLKSAIQDVPLERYPAMQLRHSPGLPDWQVAQGYQHVDTHEKVDVKE